MQVVHLSVLTRSKISAANTIKLLFLHGTEFHVYHRTRNKFVRCAQKVISAPSYQFGLGLVSFPIGTIGKCE